MTSLLDIGPLTESVPVNGINVTVYGMTPEGFFYLLHKFPQLQVLFGQSGSLSMADMTAVAPLSIAHALALVTTPRIKYPSLVDWTEAVEAAAVVAINLSAHYQMALFQSGLRLTFPDGFGPFMKAVEDLAESINRVSGKTGRATKSSKQSRSGFSTDSRGMRLGRGAPHGSSTH